MIRRILAFAALLGALLSFGSAASAQERVVLLVVDPGQARVNLDALNRAIERAIDRPIVRMTDERAQSAQGRLTIAFSNPNRWVLRYEAEGQVAWVSDRILRPGELRNRLSELSRQLVQSVEGEGQPQSAGRQASEPGRPAPRRPRDAEQRRAWTEDIILALQDEIVDPFANLPPRARARPVSVLWREVIDPFQDVPQRASSREVWSEVLDPWATEVRR